MTESCIRLPAPYAGTMEIENPAVTFALVLVVFVSPSVLLLPFAPPPANQFHATNVAPVPFHQPVP